MKKYIFYLIAFLAVSCEDVLDKKNLGAIDDSYVWSDPNMIELNVNSFYANWMPTGLFERPGLAELGIISDEARSGYNGRAVNWCAFWCRSYGCTVSKMVLWWYTQG